MESEAGGVSKSRVLHPEIIVVSSVEAYRQRARKLPTPSDAVLEIGCSTGSTTRVLALTKARVLAVDHSVLLVEQLQRDLALGRNVQVALVDGRDIPKLAALLPEPTMIFLDIGGNARLDNVALQVRLCLGAFCPRVMVVRSTELTRFLCLARTVEPLEGDKIQWIRDRRPSDDRVSHLLDLSLSSSIGRRVFAARQLRFHDSTAVRERLQEMVADHHPRVRRVAAMALRSLEEVHCRKVHGLGTAETPHA